MKYKAIIFDLDGTLLDTDLYIVLNYLNMFKKFRPSYMPSLSELVSFSGPTLQTVFSEYFPAQDFETLYEYFKDFSDKYSLKYSKLYEKEIETLDYLQSAGIRLGIVTSKRAHAAKISLEGFDLSKYMEYVITPDDIKRPKPFPDGLLLIIEKMNLSKEEVLYIGDSYTDYLAGLAANIDTGLVTWGLHKMPSDAAPDYLFNSFDEIKELIQND